MIFREMSPQQGNNKIPGVQQLLQTHTSCSKELQVDSTNNREGKLLCYNIQLNIKIIHSVYRN